MWSLLGRGTEVKDGRTARLTTIGWFVWQLGSVLPFIVTLLTSSLHELYRYRHTRGNAENYIKAAITAQRTSVVLVLAVRSRCWQLPLSIPVSLVLCCAFAAQAPWLVGVAAMISLIEAILAQRNRKKWSDPKYLDAWLADFENSKKNYALQIKAAGGVVWLSLRLLQATVHDICQMRGMWIYGEITAVGVQKILIHAGVMRQRQNRQHVRCFLDLGSGTGKTALSAAVLFPKLECAVAVELSETRHRSAQRMRHELNSCLREKRLLNRVLLVHDDIRRAGSAIASADVIWIHNTCFKELDPCIAELIEKHAQEGTLVYSIKELPFSKRAACLEQMKVGLSYWYRRTIYCVQVVGKPINTLEVPKAAMEFTRT